MKNYDILQKLLNLIWQIWITLYTTTITLSKVLKLHIKRHPVYRWMNELHKGLIRNFNKILTWIILKEMGRRCTEKFGAGIRILLSVIYSVGKVLEISCKLRTVTYWRASGPYMAIKCLQTLRTSSQFDYQLASQMMRMDFSVYDFMTGLLKTKLI